MYSLERAKAFELDFVRLLSSSLACLILLSEEAKINATIFLFSSKTGDPEFPEIIGQLPSCMTPY